jgi:hypothetical protein
VSIAEVLAEKLSGKRTASGFVCCCPAHEDTDPSLSIIDADDAPVCCPTCGRAVKRRARQQVFCSTRCRKRANYAKAVAEGKFNDPRYLGSGSGTKPQKNASDINSLQAQKSGPNNSANAPLNLLGGGSWRWPGTPPLNPAKPKAVLEAEIGSVSP